MIYTHDALMCTVYGRVGEASWCRLGLMQEACKPAFCIQQSELADKTDNISPMMKRTKDQSQATH